MSYFLDTSALAKIYHREPGTSMLHNIVSSGEPIYISELARLEFMSTAMRKVREQTLDMISLDILLARFAADLAQRFRLQFFSSLIVEEASRILLDLGGTHNLRTLDILQFAFYTTCCEHDTVFVCADQRLEEAVRGANYPTLNPLVAESY